MLSRHCRKNENEKLRRALVVRGSRTYVSDQVLRFRVHGPLGRGGRPQLLHLVVHGQHAHEFWVQQQTLNHGHVGIALVAADVDAVLFQLQVYPLERGDQLAVPCETKSRKRVIDESPGLNATHADSVILVTTAGAGDGSRRNQERRARRRRDLNARRRRASAFRSLFPTGTPVDRVGGGAHPDLNSLSPTEKSSISSGR